MNVQELKPFECVRLTEGTGGCSMHVIKGKEDEIFVTRDTEVKRVKPDPSNKGNQYMYEHFSKISGEKADTKVVITAIRTSSHDWYALLLCEMIYRGLNHEKDLGVLQRSGYFAHQQSWCRGLDLRFNCWCYVNRNDMLICVILLTIVAFVATVVICQTLIDKLKKWLKTNL